MDYKVDQFDKWIRNEIKSNWILPGISLIIFDDANILYEYTYGTKDTNTEEKISKNDRFSIASCTKSYLCTAIWKLIEDKEISNIYELTLGEIFGNDIHEAYKVIKVKNLANNTAGIPWNIIDVMRENELYHDIYKNLDDMSSSKALETISIRVLSKAPEGNPGSKFMYSSIGFSILAHILEKYSKQSFEDIIQRKIFDELGMKSATFDMDLDANYVNGHEVIDYGLAPIDMDKKKYLRSVNSDDYYSPDFIKPAGGIWCTTKDSAIYLQEYLKVINLASNFLSKHTIKQILSTESPIKMQNDNHYNFGWDVNANRITHSGGWFNMDTRYTIDIKNNIGICYNINCRYGFPINGKFIEMFSNTNQAGSDYHKYIKYKTKYLSLINSHNLDQEGGKMDNGIYFSIRGKYNNCTIILFAPGIAYDWDHERIIENGKYKTIKKINFLERLSELTQIFIYDRPELVANRAIDDHMHSTKYPPLNELNFESHVEKIHDILKNNKIKPPYIALGHSMGAFDALVFAKKYPMETKCVILLDGTRHCELMYEYTKEEFSGVKVKAYTDDEMQNMIKNVINDTNQSPNERLEKVITINNYYGLKQIGNWYQVPDKLDNIKIAGLWNIWISNDERNKDVPIKKKYDAQLGFLETMKQYHELLGNENKDYYDSYFFFGRSHNLHHSNTKEVVNIIKKYIYS